MSAQWKPDGEMPKCVLAELERASRPSQRYKIQRPAQGVGTVQNFYRPTSRRRRAYRVKADKMVSGWVREMNLSAKLGLLTKPKRRRRLTVTELEARDFQRKKAKRKKR